MMDARLHPDKARVEVFQPRPLPEDERHPAYDLLRDTHDIAPEDVGFEEFGQAYDLAGVDTVPARETDDEMLEAVFERWNSAPGETSEAFALANHDERAVSLSPGHIVRIDGSAYLCRGRGWAEMPHLSY